MSYDYRTGFVVYPDADPSAPGAKAPFLDHGGGRIDPRRYYSREEADLEWEHMWTKTWQFAGLMHDIPSVGDYFKVDIGRESVFIVRTGTGDADIKAYFNVCPHRGNRVVHADFGSAGADSCFRCDFHGWKFDLEGRNAGIRDEHIFRPETIAHRPGLKELRCGVWNSLVFINLSPEGGHSLEAHLDVMPDHMNFMPIDQFRVIGDFQVTWDANWKTAMDAFLEFYHADDVHPEVIPFSATIETQYDLYANGLSRMIIPYGYVSGRHEDQDTVNDFLKMYIGYYGGNADDYAHIKGFEFYKALADAKRKWGRRHGYHFYDNLDDRRVTDDWNYFVFPNITINFFVESLLIQIFRPHPTDPEKSVYRAISMHLPVGGTDTRVTDIASIGPEAISEPGWDGSNRPPIRTPQRFEEFGSVLSQDAMRVPEIQKGIRSRGFDGFLFSEQENRIRHYLAEIDRYLGRR